MTGMQSVGEAAAEVGHAGGPEDAWKSSRGLGGGVALQQGSCPAQGSRIAPFPHTMPHPWPPMPIVQASPFPPPPQLTQPPVFVSPPPYLPYLYPAVPAPYYVAPYTNPYATFPVPPRSDVAAPYPCTTWPYQYTYASGLEPAVNNSASPVSVASGVPSFSGGVDRMAPVVSVVTSSGGGHARRADGGTAGPAPTQSDMVVSEEVHTASMDSLRLRLDCSLSYARKRGRERLAGRRSLSRKQEQPTLSTEMTDEDRRKLLSAPVDQWVDSTYEAALRFMNVKRRPRSLSRQEDASQGKVKAVESSASVRMTTREREASSIDVAESLCCRSFPKVATVVYQNGNERQCDGYRISAVHRDLNKVAEQETSGCGTTRSPTADSEVALVQHDLQDSGWPAILSHKDNRKSCKGGTGQVSCESVTSSQAEMLSKGMSDRSRIICRELLGGRSTKSVKWIQDGVVAGEVWPRPTTQASYDGDGGSSLSQSSVSGHMEGWPDDWRRGWAQPDAVKAVVWGAECSAGADKTRMNSTTTGKSGSELINVEADDNTMWRVSVCERGPSPPKRRTDTNGLTREREEAGKAHNKGEVVNEREEGVVDIAWGSMTGRKFRPFDCQGAEDRQTKPEVISVDDDDDNDDESNNGKVCSDRGSSLECEDTRKSLNGRGMGVVEDSCGPDESRKLIFQMLLKKPLCDRISSEESKAALAVPKCSASATAAGGGAVLGLFRRGETGPQRFDMNCTENLRDDAGCPLPARSYDSDTGLGFARCA
ncbi:hypothetical protein CBR_g796 [Chara braunii]|uniref:Uncharacterized protein n=1 Tax=Chara braunii TaxID=69332 RepID=A0A388KCD5_CHABU|nr:hypothetical protein CBR_g796 [Chara braunii]|eukprot:GBG67666.1 hypothetical protein CBR_g796 [Chara braunii]